MPPPTLPVILLALLVSFALGEYCTIQFFNSDYGCSSEGSEIYDIYYSAEETTRCFWNEGAHSLQIKGDACLPTHSVIFTNGGPCHGKAATNNLTSNTCWNIDMGGEWGYWRGTRVQVVHGCMDPDAPCEPPPPPEEGLGGVGDVSGVRVWEHKEDGGGEGLGV